MTTKAPKKPTQSELIAQLQTQLAVCHEQIKAHQSRADTFAQKAKENAAATSVMKDERDAAQQRLGKLRADVLEYTLATNEPVTASTQRLAGLQREIADGCRDEPVYRTYGVSDFASLAGKSGNHFTQ